MISIPGRIPVHISPFFWIIVIMLAYLNSSTPLGIAIWSAVIVFSVLIHELGHAAAALCFGQQAEINLVGLGGLTVRRGAAIGHLRDFCVVLSGPLAGFMLSMLAFIALSSVSPENPVLFYTLDVIFEVNLFWTILNLLPILPLDGGQLLRIFLESAFGLKGLKMTAFISLLLAALGGIYFFMMAQVFIGAIFLMFGFDSYRMLSEMKEMTPEDTDSEIHHLIQSGIDDLKVHKTQEALEKFSEVRQRCGKGVVYVTATQYAARALAELGKMREAFLILYPLKKRLPRDYLIFLQQVAFVAEEWEETIEVGELIYRENQDAEVAILNAKASAILGNAIPTVGWLCQAERAGFKDIRQCVQRREFDAVRHSEPFQKWLHKSGFES